MTSAGLLLVASLYVSDCGPGAPPVELWPRCGGAAESYDPRPGDIVLFRHRDIAQNVLYTLAFAGGATHCGIVVAHPEDGRPVLLEAPGRRYPVLLSEVHDRVRSFEGKVWVRRRTAPAG